MKKYFAIFGLLTAFVMSVNVAKADPGPYGAFLSTDPCDSSPDAIITPCDDGAGTVDVIDTVNYLLSNASVASPFSTNEDLDAIQLNYDHQYWTNSGGDAALAFISVSAGGNNIPGLYEYGFPGAPVYLTGAVTGSQFVGDGSNADPYPGLINPFSGSTFGFLVDHSGQDAAIYYSDVSLNPDQKDHVMAFDLRSYLDGTSLWLDTNDDGIADIEVTLNDTYLLAFEDLPLNDVLTQNDYNDGIFLLTRVTPVPEPMTMALFGTGLLGMAVRRRKA